MHSSSIIFLPIYWAHARVRATLSRVRARLYAYFQAATARVRIVAKRQDAGLLVGIIFIISVCDNRMTIILETKLVRLKYSH